MADLMENFAPEALVVAIADVRRGSCWSLRRVTPGQQRDLRLSAFECHGVRFRQLQTYRRRRRWPLGAQEQLMHRNNSRAYSMTLSARPRSGNGMLSPSVLAVFILITSSNLVACSIGRSAGLVPLRILST